MKLKQCNNFFVNSKEYIVNLWKTELSQYVVQTLNMFPNYPSQFDIDNIEYHKFIRHVNTQCKSIEYFFQHDFDFLLIYVDNSYNPETSDFIIGNVNNTTQFDKKNKNQILVPTDVPIQFFLNNDHQLKIIIPSSSYMKLKDNNRYIIRSKKSIMKTEFLKI